MSGITVDRLSLKVSGFSESDGRHLARLIADGLSRASASVEATGHREALRLSLSPRPGTALDALAGQIVSELLRQLNRSI
jgi:hypothetical protein